MLARLPCVMIYAFEEVCGFVRRELGVEGSGGRERVGPLCQRAACLQRAGCGFGWTCDAELSGRLPAALRLLSIKL